MVIAVARMSFFKKVAEINSLDTFKNALGVMEKLCLTKQLRSELENAFPIDSGIEGTKLSQEEMGGLIDLVILHSAE